MRALRTSCIVYFLATLQKGFQESSQNPVIIGVPNTPPDSFIHLCLFVTTNDQREMFSDDILFKGFCKIKLSHKLCHNRNYLK